MSFKSRRNLIKFAGWLGAAALADLPEALAQTWQKVGNPSGSAGTWQKLAVASGGGAPRVSAVSWDMVGTGRALRSDGLIFATGQNFYGQLGDNSTTSKSSFVQCVGISNAVATGNGGSSHGLALRSDGLVFACGYNINGQLGDNTTASKRTYVQSIGISNAVAIAGGGTASSNYFSLALRSDGLVFGCGLNLNGQLGDNSVSSRRTFVQATGISNAVAISAGNGFSLALRSSGDVFACGGNTYGQLGDNTVTFKSTYVQSLGISNAVAITASGGIAGADSFSLALRSDGLVFACGYNTSGQLGDNTVVSKRTFIQTTGISNAISISAGGNHSLALRADGLVFGCGDNTYGQLGDNSIVKKSTYVQALGISNAIAVAAGSYVSLALRADGVIFACGLNWKGELGDGTTTDRSTYVQAVGV